MFWSWLKAALRNARRQKGYFAISVGGMAIGLACCLLILVWVTHELSYDRFHEHRGSIYRLVMDRCTPAETRHTSMTSAPLAPALKADIPQVEYAARVLRGGRVLVRHEATAFYEDRTIIADQDLLHVLSYDFLQGSAEGALAEPSTLLITEKIAQKYFNTTDVVGRSLTLGQNDYRITGVIADLPSNTFLKFDLVRSLATFAGGQFMKEWNWNVGHTYVKLKNEVDAEQFAGSVLHFADKYVDPAESGEQKEYFLQPVEDIHLHSNLLWEMEPPGSMTYVIGFSAIALLILLMATINFMNLTAAQTIRRARETGMRRVIGASRWDVIMQFVGESILYSVIALVIALTAVELLLPTLSEVSGKELSGGVLANWKLVLIGAGLTLLAGLASGLWPALVMSSLKPVVALKGLWSGSGRLAINLRRALVVFQFTLSFILVVGALTVLGQIDFMRSADLGFDKEHKLVIPLSGLADLADNYETLLDEFRQHPDVTEAAISSAVPGRTVPGAFSVSRPHDQSGTVQQMKHLQVEPGFLRIYGVEMLAGRNFQKEMGTDREGGFIINRAAVYALGWTAPEEALDQVITAGSQSRDGTVIGVTDDFHWRGLQEVVAPMVMEWAPQRFAYLTLNLTEHTSTTVGTIGGAWQRLYPDRPFEYFFLDTDYDLQYASEERTARVIGSFTVLGIFIAALGVLGLASLSAEKRRKEVCIRRVFGASVAGALKLLVKEYVILAVVASLIGLPVAYYVAGRWLESFAYSISVSWTVLLISALVSLAVTVLASGWHAMRAAVGKPAEVLRYE